MFKGETFFETACRKIRDETGHTDAAVQPVAVLNVWNTFFPDSNWDAERAPGREGTQTVNICVLCVLEDSEGEGGGEAGGPADLDIKSAASAAWAVEARRWVTVDEVLLTNDYDKYVSLNVRRAVELGYM